MNPKTPFKQWTRKPLKPPLLLGWPGPHLIHECLSWPHSQVTTLNGNLIAWRTLVHNYTTNPIGYNGTPPNHPKIAHFPWAISTPIWYSHPSTDPTHHPKRHPDPISRFTTIHPLDRQTDTDRQTHRPADWIGDKPVRIPTYALLYCSDAANNVLGCRLF